MIAAFTLQEEEIFWKNAAAEVRRGTGQRSPLFELG